MDETTRLRQELERLLYRRGDLATMRDDLTAQVEALDREATATIGAIHATRLRLGNLDAQARNRPNLVPMDMTPTMDVQPVIDGKPAQLAKK